MVSAINSRVRKAPPQSSALAAPIERVIRTAPVPLLALRLPQFERLAWRDGKAAAKRLERDTSRIFQEAALRALRGGDSTAHDAGSDVFIIAMTAAARECRALSAPDVRTVLERIAAELSARCGLRVETGWTMLHRFDAAAGIRRHVDAALERGARERERYEFFAAIAHELRTPLSSIRGYLETLIDGRAGAAHTAQFLHVARREALRMSRLLDGMLEFSLLDVSGAGVCASSCDVGRQIRMACEVVRPLARQRGITLRRRRHAGASVALDADACLQLVVNLLENAIKYGRDGGTVAIEADVRAAEVLVRVDDDGPGIAAGERDSIFAMRTRGAHADERPGTGIGLAIVKMIAERAGGSVRVSDSPFGGARFEASLPRKAELPVAAS